MNVIRLTYSNDMNPMFIKYLTTFFRFAGIEVQENITNQNIPLILLSFASKTTKKFDDYELEIKIESSLTEDFNVILKDVLNKDSSSCYTEIIGHDEKPYFFLGRLLSNLKNKDYISLEEFFDLQGVLDIYRRFQVFNTLAKSNQLLKVDLHFEPIFYELLKTMRENDTKFGTPKLIHTQLAAIITLYKYDCFNLLKDEPLPVNVETIIKKCELIKRANNDVTCKNITRLEALTYGMIEGNFEKASEVSRDFYGYIDRFHTLSVSPKLHYKREFWRIVEYEELLAHFRNDYRIWLCMGEYYSDSNHYKETEVCYENAFLILYNLLQKCKLVPDEIEQMFYLITNLLKLYTHYSYKYNRDELTRYVEVIERSLRLLNKSIDNLRSICSDENGFQLLKKTIYSKANLKVIYNHLKDLVSILGYSDKVQEYDEKLLMLPHSDKQ